MFGPWTDFQGPLDIHRANGNGANNGDLQEESYTFCKFVDDDNGRTVCLSEFENLIHEKNLQFN